MQKYNISKGYPSRFEYLSQDEFIQARGSIVKESVVSQERESKTAWEYPSRRFY